ncbi:hypothetical protein M407DRAFT_19225 [Tulasnella calospora MUT 4182]|uniref:non-specific serine/threonine protein kinase n=1 Tax=Tulasnella calospora MUT 4182 TaxID=1051891 RepID=A0A0C3QTT6_9AGAM|nr:hypothetical protein M407DRAFT_19225 [Tulasnella calospora MUT 4182]
MNMESHQPTLAPGDQVFLGRHYVTVEKFLRLGPALENYPVENYCVLAKSLQKPNTVALRTLRKIPHTSKYLVDAALGEFDILASPREGGHPHIVELIDHATLYNPYRGRTTYNIYYLFADEEIGTLADIIEDLKKANRKPSEKEVLEIALQICEAVSFLHNFRPPLIHRNISPNNIVKTNRNVVKLSGFMGVALELDPYALDETIIPVLLDDIICYTDLCSRSPEMVTPQVHLGITTKSDVWSMGVVLYSAAFKRTIFPLDSSPVKISYQPHLAYRHVVAIIGKYI